MSGRHPFARLLSASFISQVGSYFLTLALVTFVYQKSGSIVRSSLVFVFSYLPAVLVSGYLGSILDRLISRRLLIINEAVSAAVSALCGLCLVLAAPLPVLCVVLSLRSVLLFVARTGGSKWIKVISPQSMQDARIKIFFLIFFLSTAIAGVLAATVLSWGSIFTVVALDVGTYLSSMVVLFTLPPLPTPERAAAASSGGTRSSLGTIAEILRTPALATPFLLVGFSQATFQGAYGVFVSYLPIHQLKLGTSGVGLFQLAASFGITCGFLINWFFAARLTAWTRRALPVALIATIGAMSLMVAANSMVVPLSLGVFFLQSCAYEVLWLASSAAFFRESPSERTARYQFALSATGAFLMAAATLFYSLAIDWLGSGRGSAWVLGIGLCLWAMSHLVVWRATRAPKEKR